MDAQKDEEEKKRGPTQLDGRDADDEEDGTQDEDGSPLAQQQDGTRGLLRAFKDLDIKGKS